MATPENYKQVVNIVVNGIIKDGIVPLLFALAIVYFLWGGFKFIQSAGDSKARDEGKKRMFFGIIGIAVMIAVWTLVKIVAGTIGITDFGIPQFK